MRSKKRRKFIRRDNKTNSKKESLRKFDLATKMRNFLEFQKCKCPQHYARDLGYDVLRGFPFEPNVKGKRALIYTIENEKDKIHIRIKGRTISGAKVNIKTKAHDIFKEEYLMGAISKWSHYAYKIDANRFKDIPEEKKLTELLNLI